MRRSRSVFNAPLVSSSWCAKPTNVCVDENGVTNIDRGSRQWRDSDRQSREPMQNVREIEVWVVRRHAALNTRISSITTRY